MFGATCILLLASCTQEPSTPEWHYSSSPLFDYSDEALAALRHEFEESNPPDEIVALFGQSTWGSEGQRVIRVRGGVARLAFYHYSDDPPPNPRARVLSPEEWSQVQSLMADPGLVKPDLCVVYDAMEYTYVHLTREEETTFYMGSPSCYTRWVAQERGEPDLFPGARVEQSPGEGRVAFELLLAIRALGSRQSFGIKDMHGLYLVEDE